MEELENICDLSDLLHLTMKSIHFLLTPSQTIYDLGDTEIPLECTIP